MKSSRLLVHVVILAAVVTSPLVAAADTVYLKNGRTISSSSVRVEGDRVFVRLYQGEVAFPMALVERIEENEAVEPPTTLLRSTPAAAEEAAEDPDPTAGESLDEAAAGSDEAAASDEDAAAEAPEPPVEETRQYWQDRVRPLHQEITRINGEIASLSANVGAGVQARITRLEAQRGRLEAELEEIEREARRLGVPAGWLRIR